MPAGKICFWGYFILLISMFLCLRSTWISTQETPLLRICSCQQQSALSKHRGKSTAWWRMTSTLASFSPTVTETCVWLPPEHWAWGTTVGHRTVTMALKPIWSHRVTLSAFRAPMLKPPCKAEYTNMNKDCIHSLLTSSFHIWRGQTETECSCRLYNLDSSLVMSGYDAQY